MISGGVSGVLLLLGALTFWLALRRPTVTIEAVAVPPGLQATLNAITVHVLSYLHDRDPQHLEQIRLQGETASRELKSYEAALSPKSRAETDSNYESLREATLAILAADESEADSIAHFQKAHERLNRTLRDRLLPRLKPLQLGFAGRQQAFLDLQSASSGISDALNAAINDRAMPDPSTLIPLEAAFHLASNRWAEAGRFGRGVPGPEECKSAFDESLRVARSVIRNENVRRASIQQYLETYKTFDTILRTRSGEKPVETPPSPNRWPLAAVALVLSSLGVAGLFFADRLFVKTIIQPIQQLLQATDAAATGDLSRAPDLWSHDEVGQLSQSLSRLITVLARSENLVYHLASLVELSGDAIISQSLDGTILSWNKGAQRIYGYSADEVKGQSITLLTPDDEGIQLQDVLEQLKSGEKIQPFEMIHKAKNGRTVHAFVRVAAIQDSLRRIIGASFCAQDLSDTALRAPAEQRALPEAQTPAA